MSKEHAKLVVRIRSWLRAFFLSMSALKAAQHSLLLASLRYNQLWIVAQRLAGPRVQPNSLGQHCLATGSIEYNVSPLASKAVGIRSGSHWREYILITSSLRLLSLVFDFVWRGCQYGAVGGLTLGALYGTLIFPILGTLLGGIYGAVLGLVLGFGISLLLSFITIVFFTPLHNHTRYRWNVRVMGVTVSSLSMGLYFYLATTSNTFLTLFLFVALPALLSAGYAFWVVDRIVDWYQVRVNSLLSTSCSTVSNHWQQQAL